MRIQYFTQKGSIYICQTNGSGSSWLKRDHNGLFLPLARAIHLPRTRLQELIRDYPTSALDSTMCFASGLAKEFFEDARREHIADIPAGQETNIFFLLSKGDGRYALGYSSTIQRIEKTENVENIKEIPYRPAM